MQRQNKTEKPIRNRADLPARSRHGAQPAWLRLKQCCASTKIDARLLDVARGWSRCMIRCAYIVAQFY